MGRLKVSLYLLLLSLTPGCLGHDPVQYQKQTEYGTYKYGYDTGSNGAHSYRQEHRGFDGIVHGRYGYTDPDGVLRHTEYSAGPFGYKVKGDNEPSYFTEDGQPRTDYKVPTDTELTDLDAGLAKIAKQQLFGVPVQPYVKGYVGTPPPATGKVDVVQPLPQPPVVQVPVKGQVELPPPPVITPVKSIVRVPEPPPVKSIFTVHEPPPVKSIVTVPLPPPVKSIVNEPYPPPPVHVVPVVVQHVVKPTPRVVVRVKPEGGRPYLKDELPPHRRKVVVKTRPQVPVAVPVQPVIHEQAPVQPVVPIQPVVPVQAVIPPQNDIVKEEIFTHQVPEYAKGYVPLPPPPPAVTNTFVREELFQNPVVPAVTKSFVPPADYTKSVFKEDLFTQNVPAYTKGYVPPIVAQHQPVQPVAPIVVQQQPVVPVVVHQQPAPVKAIVREQVVQEAIPVPPKSIIREQIFQSTVPVAPKTVVSVHTPASPVVPHTIVREQVLEHPVVVPPKSVTSQHIFQSAVPVAPKTIGQPKTVVHHQVIQQAVPVPPTAVVREQIFQSTVPVAPKTIVREHIFDQSVPVHPKSVVQQVVPVPPTAVVREQIFQSPVPAVPKTIVREHIFDQSVPVHPKSVVRQQIVEEVLPKPVVRQHVVENHVPVAPQTIVREQIFQKPVQVAPKSLFREQIFAVPVPEYAKGYVPSKGVVRQDVAVQHPAGFVPAPKPQSLYVKGFVTTPRPFAAPLRPSFVPVSSRSLFAVPAPTYTKGYVPEARRQEVKSVSVQAPILSRGDSGVNARWVAAPEGRYRQEYRLYRPEYQAYDVEYAAPPAHAYAPY